MELSRVQLPGDFCQMRISKSIFFNQPNADRAEGRRVAITLPEECMGLALERTTSSRRDAVASKRLLAGASRPKFGMDGKDNGQEQDIFAGSRGEKTSGF